MGWHLTAFPPSVQSFSALKSARAEILDILSPVYASTLRTILDMKRSQAQIKLSIQTEVQSKEPEKESSAAHGTVLAPSAEAKNS